MANLSQINVHVSTRTISGDEDLIVVPSTEYVGHVTGGGAINYWDGTAFVPYDDSGPGFRFLSPVSGLLRVTSPATYSLRKKDLKMP